MTGEGVRPSHAQEVSPVARYALLIHARSAVVDGRLQQAAVTVDGGVISSVRTGSDARDIGLAGDHTINLGDDVVLMPGLVDPHVSTEDVAAATRSAAQGGITSVIDYGTDGDPVATKIGRASRRERGEGPQGLVAA